MPLSVEKNRVYQREYARRRRRAFLSDSKEAARAKGLADNPDPKPPHDPAGAIAEWSKARLVVPPGHPRAGEPMEMPDFAIHFLRAALRDNVREAGLFCARKNAKSAVIAILLLGFLLGPLRRRGFRAGVASLNREKCADLWQQCQDIAQASHLEGLKFGIVPRHVRSSGGRVEFLAADHAGQSSSYDLAICDELGLFPPKGKAVVDGMLSSTSAKNGRLIAISVLGNGALAACMVKRREDPATVVHLYQPDENCTLDDERAWYAANPGLGTVKSISYMRDMARRAEAGADEERAFRLYDLNLPGELSKEMIVSLARYRICENQPKPDRAGVCFLGFDMGGSSSMTAAAAFWPSTGRLDIWGAYGADPLLAKRGELDRVGDRYIKMQKRGELQTFPGRVTPCADFFAWIAEELKGERIQVATADRYRQAEGLDALDKADVNWPMEWRAQGSGKDGSADVRAFQASIESNALRPGESLLLYSAISESAIRYDNNGNPALEKGRAKGRIDALSAVILAVGAGARARTQPTTFFYHGPNI